MDAIDYITSLKTSLVDEYSIGYLSNSEYILCVNIIIYDDPFDWTMRDTILTFLYDNEILFSQISRMYPCDEYDLHYKICVKFEDENSIELFNKFISKLKIKLPKDFDKIKVFRIASKY